MPEASPIPKVSVGLPVYNGERYVAQAIESILAQTYENLELIISDNASTDRTSEICEHYAALDRRVRYLRQEVNLGAARNFNRVFELANDSKYFKWAAHDDWIAPTFLRECITTLETSPDAVLCQSLAEIVSGDGQLQGTYDHTARGTGLARPSSRFWARLNGGPHCIEVFGVIRSSALATTGLIANHISADRTLLLELALLGRFVLVPQVLFFNRNHSGRFSRQRYSSREKVAWYGAATGSMASPTWTRYGEWLAIIRRHAGSRSERFRCYVHLLRSLGSRRRWLLLFFEPLVVPNPRLNDCLKSVRGWAGTEWPRSRTKARAGRMR